MTVVLLTPLAIRLGLPSAAMSLVLALTGLLTGVMVTAGTVGAAPPVPPAPPPITGPGCVWEIKRGDWLSTIVETIGDPGVTVESLQAENGIANPDLINEGDRLDVCVGNGIDDRIGVPHPTPEAQPEPTVAIEDPVAVAVAAQQTKLNELFGPFGMTPLAVDGISGRYTQQQLCAARVLLGLPVSRNDMEPGSLEEAALMLAPGVGVPPDAPSGAGRWVMIDQTCQILFAGEGGDRLTFIFPTSTGDAEHRTRSQNASRAFRFNPASNNNGWHNSSIYPVADDNPLNGNMYKPIYFDRGQAIHGANNVPTSPASKGCARLTVAAQDALVNWLGLSGVTRPIWDTNPINLTVRIQGDYYDPARNRPDY